MVPSHDSAVSGTVEERLLERARSPADAAALARFDARMAFPLVLAAVLPLFLIPGESDSIAVGVVVILSWVVFLVDFVVHERRLRHYLHTWMGRFDLLVVVLTAPWFLVLGPSESKFVLLIRLARLSRVVMATAGARRLFERLGRVALVAGVVVLVGAAVAYGAEHPVNPEFATYGDAVWWAIVTLTTVGYGDIVPKTTAGRVVGVMIMVTGIAVLGLLAGSLAGYFRLDPAARASRAAPPDGGETSEAPAAATESASLTEEIAALRAQVTRLADEVAHLSPPSDEPPSTAPGR
jgi:voltage-gated potassium channel